MLGVLTSSNLCVFLLVISSRGEAVVLTLLVLKCALKIKLLDLTEAEVSFSRTVKKQK